MKFGVQFIFHPTPEKMRNVGDTLLSAFNVAGVSTILATHSSLGLIVMGVGYGLKIVSNMFTH